MSLWYINSFFIINSNCGCIIIKIIIKELENGKRTVTHENLRILDEEAILNQINY